MSGLNDNHKLRLRTTFQYMDELLSEVVRLVDSSPAQSPFSEHIPDATPIQSRVIADYAARLRAQMRAVLERIDVPLPEPNVSSVWAARTVLSSIDIALEEIKPKYMRGYGELPQEAAHELDLAVAQLADLLGRMETYLAQGSGRDLHARLQRLESTTDEARLLRELERVITSRGLVEFRPTLEMLAERLETNAFEVAVFGKVSSGKSSLLNHILKSDVLPIGVTPVTTIPTRIVYGPAPRVTIRFAEAPPTTVEPSRLAEFVTEQQNPGNAKHVSRIVVEIPADTLKDGITFVDTPGVGSLAQSGAAESLAYLPRCDLGIVLVDASATLTHEDIALVDSLYRSGAQGMLLLSKGDVLSAPDRQPMVQYMRQQLKSNLGIDVPVHLVSVKGEAASLCDQWFAEALLPALTQHRQLAAASLRRKIGTLREAVVAAIRKRLDRQKGPDARTVDSARWQQAERAIASAFARLDEARRRPPESLEHPDAWAAQVLDRVASRSAADWNGQHGAARDLTPVAVEEAARAGQRLAEGVVGELLDLRHSLADALALAAQAVGADSGRDDELPSPTGVPILDRMVNANLDVPRPLLAFLGRRVLERHIQRWIQPRVSAQLVGMFHGYSKRIEEWRLRSLNDLRREFAARADVYRALANQPPVRDEEELESIRRDLDACERAGDAIGSP